MPEAQPQQPAKTEQPDGKQLKKLLESHLTVLEHKLGRPPQLEEMIAFLDDGEGAPAGDPANPQPNDAGSSPEQPGAEGDPAMPKVLNYKVYYGMGGDGEEKKPDPNRVLFYETHDGRVYDTTRHEWAPARLPIMDHLPCRPILHDDQGHDVMSALIHGVLDDEDFAELDKSKLLNDHHREIWKLNKQLQSQMSQLEKSEEGDEEPANGPAEGCEDYDDSRDACMDDEPADSAPSDTDAGPSEQGGGYGDPEAGETINAIKEIMRVALASATGDIEDRVRALVAEEFDRHMSSFIAAMEHGEEPSQDFPTAETDAAPAPTQEPPQS